MSDNVFISYASEDREVAKRLYNDLTEEGIKPWMDKADLLPGQDREVHIKKAIRESKYFIALLSSDSLSKKGSAQKELKFALDILGEFPGEDIFIIPARLDDCKPIDERLKSMHPADLFPCYEYGLNQILRVLLPENNNNAIKRFENHQKANKKIFVLYGRVSNFENAVSELNEYIRSNENILYFQFDIRKIKCETFSDTLFEIIHQLGDQIAQELTDISSKSKWDDTLRLFRKVRDEKFDLPDDDKLAEFVSVADSILYLDLKDIFHHLKPVIISFGGFELLGNWIPKIYNFLLRRMVEKVGISALVFIWDEHKPNLFNGSDEKSIPDYVTFHKLEGEAVPEDIPKPPAVGENLKDNASDLEGFIDNSILSKLDEQYKLYKKHLEKDDYSKVTEVANFIYKMFESIVEKLNPEKERDVYLKLFALSSYWKLNRDLYNSKMNHPK